MADDAATLARPAEITEAIERLSRALLGLRKAAA